MTTNGKGPTWKPPRPPREEQPKFIPLFDAANELAQALNICHEAAHMTLKGLCATGNVSSWNGQFEIIDIEKVTVDRFGRPGATGCAEWVDADEVRHYIAEWSNVPSSNNRDRIIQQLLKEGFDPPRKINWKEFYKRVRDEAKGWLGDRRPAPGFSDKQIQRIVKGLRSI